MPREWFINCAVSFDGRLSEQGKPVAISSAEDNYIVHSFRNEIAGIGVGSTTVIVDNPSLRTRVEHLPDLDPNTLSHPIRLVFDRSGRCTPELSIFQDQDRARTIWITNSDRDIPGIIKISGTSLEQIQKDVNQILDEMGKDGDVMIEGGGKLITSFIESGLISKMRVYRGPILLPDGVPLFLRPVSKELVLVETRKLGPGIEEHYTFK